MYYWGFDLGDGESAIARVSEDRMKMPEIMEVEGNKVFITAWALMKNGEVRIGENAAKAASAALRSAVSLSAQAGSWSAAKPRTASTSAAPPAGTPRRGSATGRFLRPWAARRLTSCPNPGRSWSAPFSPTP